MATFCYSDPITAEEIATLIARAPLREVDRLVREIVDYVDHNDIKTGEYAVVCNSLVSAAEEMLRKQRLRQEAAARQAPQRKAR